MYNNSLFVVDLVCDIHITRTLSLLRVILTTVVTCSPSPPNGSPILYKLQLSSQNLIFSSEDDEAAVLKVIDFGFARLLPEAPQVLTTPCYTLPYGAPEVISHSNGYTESCDIWSLGVILVSHLCC